MKERVEMMKGHRDVKRNQKETKARKEKVIRVEKKRSEKETIEEGTRNKRKKRGKWGGLEDGRKER